MQALVAGARDALAYKWDAVSREFDAASSPAAKRRALEAMLGAVLKAPALAQEDLRLQRDLVLGHMSRVLGISEETLRSEIARMRRATRRSAAGTSDRGLPDAAARGPRWAAERELMTVLVCRPSRFEKAVETLPPDRIEDADFRRLYEALLANAARRDGDIGSIVLGLEDAGLSSLAVQLFERGEAFGACREVGDTGAGPLGRLLDDALADLRRMEEQGEIQTRSRAARENKSDDTQALRAFVEARMQRPKGFVDPLTRRKSSPGT
jgi:hypothetical protein